MIDDNATTTSNTMDNGAVVVRDDGAVVDNEKVADVSVADASARLKKYSGISVDGNTMSKNGENFLLFDIKSVHRKEWQVVRLFTDKKKSLRELRTDDALGALCLICKKTITFSKGNGNSVFRHVQNAHKSEFQAIVAPSKRKLDDDETMVASSPTKKPNTISSHFSVKMKDMPKACRTDQLRADALLVKSTSLSLRPFSIVEDPGFLELVDCINRLKTLYVPPGRKKHTRQMQCVDKLSSLVHDNGPS